MQSPTKRRGTRDEECPPYALWVQTSNPVDGKTFAKDMVTVEPAIPGFKVMASGNAINISGATKGRTTYKATFSSRIPDTFGQTLGKDEVVTFKTGKAQKSLFTTGGQFVVLDPVAKAKYSVYSVNYDSLRVKLFAAQPGDWDRFAKYVRGELRRELPKDPPPVAVSSELVPVKARQTRSPRPAWISRGARRRASATMVG